MSGKLRTRSALEEALAIELKHLLPGLPFKRQYRFHPERRWLFDFAWPKHMVAVEVEGGTWVGGRHTRPQGYASDCEKYNEATRLGWSVYRFTREHIVNGQAASYIQEVLTKYAGDTPS